VLLLEKIGEWLSGQMVEWQIGWMLIDD